MENYSVCTMSEAIDMFIKQRFVFNSMNSDMVFWKLGIYFPYGIKSNKRTNQEGAENWFLTSVTVTYLAPGTAQAPASRSEAGHSAGPRPTVKIGPESGRVKLNLQSSFKEFP